MNKPWVIIKTSKEKYTINLNNIIWFSSRAGAQNGIKYPSTEAYYEIILEDVSGDKLFLSFHKDDAKLYRNALRILHNALFNTSWQNKELYKHQNEVLNDVENKENQ